MLLLLLLPAAFACCYGLGMLLPLHDSVVVAIARAAAFACCCCCFGMLLLPWYAVAFT